VLATKLHEGSGGGRLVEMGEGCRGVGGGGEGEIKDRAMQADSRGDVARGERKQKETEKFRIFDRSGVNTSCSGKTSKLYPRC
jgi:hypothetical protein